MTEATGLLRRPQRAFPLIQRLVSDKLRVTFEQRHLYSYTTIRQPSVDVLNSLLRWILDAQRPDGGIPAYYSLLTGYSQSYPEVTGYLIPTLYDFAGYESARSAENFRTSFAAYRATHWLLSLQIPSPAFPAGLHGAPAKPSIFNTGQILQGLVRAYIETARPDILASALAAGDWLILTQQQDGSWSGDGGYRNSGHTYYSRVS